jgi:hypothetical protein
MVFNQFKTVAKFGKQTVPLPAGRRFEEFVGQGYYASVISRLATESC